MSVWERRLSPPGGVGCLGSFVSVGGPEGRNVVAEKEKGNVDHRVILVCLSRSVCGSGTMLNLALDMICCTSLLFQGHPWSPTSSRRRAAAAWVVELERAVFYSFSAGCSARLAAAFLSLPLLFSSFPFLSLLLGLWMCRVLERCFSLGAFVSPSFSLIE